MKRRKKKFDDLAHRFQTTCGCGTEQKVGANFEH